jgi:hypothetical protein
VAVAREPGQPIVSVQSIDELDRRFGTRGVGSRLPLQFLNSQSVQKGHFYPYPDPYRAEVIDRRYTPDELRTVISEAEELIGGTVDDLVVRHQLGASSRTPPRHPHRLVERLLLLRQAADNPSDRLA